MESSVLVHIHYFYSFCLLSAITDLSSLDKYDLN